MLPGSVKFVVHPAWYFRHFVDQVDVGFGIQMSENFVRIVEYVEMFDVAESAEFVECLLDGLRSTNVASASRGGEYKDAFEHSLVKVELFASPAGPRGPTGQAR